MFNSCDGQRGNKRREQTGITETLKEMFWLTKGQQQEWIKERAENTLSMPKLTVQFTASGMTL